MASVLKKLQKATFTFYLNSQDKSMGSRLRVPHKQSIAKFDKEINKIQ